MHSICGLPSILPAIRLRLVSFGLFKVITYALHYISLLSFSFNIYECIIRITVEFLHPIEKWQWHWVWVLRVWNQDKLKNKQHKKRKEKENEHMTTTSSEEDGWTTLVRPKTRGMKKEMCMRRRKTNEETKRKWMNVLSSGSPTTQTRLTTIWRCPRTMNTRRRRVQMIMMVITHINIVIILITVAITIAIHAYLAQLHGYYSVESELFSSGSF